MPNRAQAFVAALVQVTNTTANPVPNWGVDNPAGNVFRLTGELPLPGTKATTGSLGRPSDFPSGSRIVIAFFGTVCNTLPQHPSAGGTSDASPNPVAEIASLTPRTLPDGRWDGTHHRYTFIPQQGASFFNSGEVPSLASVDHVVAQSLRLYVDSPNGPVHQVAASVTPAGASLKAIQLVARTPSFSPE